MGTQPSTMDKLFGSADLMLLGQDGAKTPVSTLAGKQVVGIYFSAHWCPPCRGFTPKLVEAYEKITADGKSFEIVFVSSDKDEEQFTSYFKDMPWLALPFENRDLKKALSRKFKVSGIPALILLDGETGHILNKDGRTVLMGDATGTKFPWRQKPVQDLLGNVVLNCKGDEINREEALQDKYLALYFSAHWCPPCKRFTPELAKTYAAIKAQRDDFELVFVSGDRDEKSFKDYFSQMPWLALPFDEDRYGELSSRLEVEGIPTLVVLDRQGNVVTTKGREAAMADPEGSEFPWQPKPVNSLEDGVFEDWFDGLHDTKSSFHIVDLWLHAFDGLHLSGNFDEWLSVIESLEDSGGKGLLDVLDGSGLGNSGVSITSGLGSLGG